MAESQSETARIKAAQETAYASYMALEAPTEAQQRAYLDQTIAYHVAAHGPKGDIHSCSDSYCQQAHQVRSGLSITQWRDSPEGVSARAEHAKNPKKPLPAVLLSGLLSVLIRLTGS